MAAAATDIQHPLSRGQTAGDEEAGSDRVDDRRLDGQSTKLDRPVAEHVLVSWTLRHGNLVPVGLIQAVAAPHHKLVPNCNGRELHNTDIGCRVCG